MYAALDNDLHVLAAIAVRTVIDHASQLRGADPATGFPEKLDRLRADGKISSDERESLKVLVDAGNAAVHRGWPPPVDKISTMVGVVETFLHRVFVLDDGIKKLGASVPARQKKRQRIDGCRHTIDEDDGRRRRVFPSSAGAPPPNGSTAHTHEKW